MANPGKDTVYIDAEDEITAVIEKVVSAKHKVVAIVLPKRSTVFQSVVNLKLLKKAASSAKKNIVLITSDASILAIAGSVGVHVAKTPTSKPVIPAAVATKAATETVHVDDADESSVNLKKAAVVGTGLAAVAATTASDGEEAIELDNTSPIDKKTDSTEKSSTKKKKKIAKIPDFSSFTMKMWLGFGLIVILAVMWVFGFVIMPNATVTVNTDVSTTSINTTVTAQVGESELVLEDNIIPAARVQAEKIDSVTVAATGEKNKGQKATGEITLTNCIKDDEKKVIPAGTAFSKNNLRFVTSEQIILGPAVYVGSNCISADFPGLGAQGTVGAIADSPGTEFNVSEGSFVSSISGIQAYGSDMTGGSSEVVKVISQEDVDKATQELAGASKNEALSELQKQLRDEGDRPVDVTLIESTPAIVASPAVGAEADETKVTMTVNYSLLGVKDDDINQILDKEVKENLGDTPVNIRNNGLEGVKFTLSESSDEANTVLTLETVATIGPEINEVEIKDSIVGKKRGDIEKQIESIDGVRSVSVEYSPFWITTTPKSAKKINIIFVESDGN
jgi:hypothetical protein